MRYLFLVLFIGGLAGADAGSKLSHESEAGVVLASGNTDTQTYSVKQLTQLAWESSLAKFTGSYLMAKTQGTETARKWDLGLRYEQLLSTSFSAFAGYQLDSDIFSGIDLRHAFDLGTKYALVKTTATEVNAELGYRLLAEKLTDNSSATSHFVRTQANWQQTWNESVSSRVALEYLQSLNNSSDSRINFEPSLSVLLTNVFSLKIAYLVNFRNAPALPGKKQTDTLYTTSLVAKF